MGGEGSMLSAIVSLKNNRAILKKRKIRELKDILYEVSGKTEVEFKKLSHAEFEILKSQIRKQAKKDAQWEILAYILAFFFTGLIVWAVIWLFK
ncbi:hypothetical protein [Robiginitalea biformata]|uniref:Uncharacterized protein n=1 Tax=Robiginitalea biformata (strain ATCC BAA-864 / DSM 15991 / KCTC 12146 / HTCC2501) TaxID=313596 RepID=A4CN57_ROBBH|nr:hypothetical protein [Robiginitalea biformata]EAR15099.1 hypothetical protein RB2501_12252 [Robiginitalea biformata HTCC2501]